MSKRTQIVCIHEGKKGHSIDPVFANAFLKAYNPEWLRPYKTGMIRLVGYGGKTALMEAFPGELKACHSAGGNTTLVVLADVDDGLDDPEQLKKKYREAAQSAGIPMEMFEAVVFIFPKDRLENWVEFIETGSTDESREGPRTTFSKAKEAAASLAKKCRNSPAQGEHLPLSLDWSCRNWHSFVERMRK